MTRVRLFDHAPTRRNLSKCRELVQRPTDACTTCGGPTRTERMGELALFFHGGYGADRVTVFALCENYDCRAVRVRYVTEANPRKHVA